MTTVASIVTVAMGFLAALLLFNANVMMRRGGRREGDENVFRERQAKMRTLGITAAVVAVVAAYVAALVG